MKKRMSVDISELEPFEKFLKSKGIQIDLTTSDDADIEALKSDDHRLCDMDTLYSGGWITCETAQALAGKLGIQKLQMGSILNFLNIKIRNCSLGCFQ